MPDSSADSADLRTTLARADQVDELADVMAAAFADDPVMRWLFEPAADVDRAIHTFFSLALPAARQRGHTYRCGTPTTPAAGAIWLPPDVHDLFIDPTPMGAFLTADVGGDGADRLASLSELMAAHHPAAPAFHLLLLGVVPDRQGRGLGRLAMQPVIDRCDHDGLPAYLESSNPRNIPFYERLGFEIVNSFAPAEGVELAGMWREPR